MKVWDMRIPGLESACVETYRTLGEVATSTMALIASGRVALSGGATYVSLFALWRSYSLDCSAAEFYPVDERIVSFDDPGSNWGVAWREFLVHVGRSQDREHFPADVEQYTALLRRSFSLSSDSELPVFDAVFLGVGDDGHTASLFPGGAYLDDRSHLVLETQSPKPPCHRLTLGPAVLAAAREVVVVVFGEGKRRSVERILSGDPALPIVRVLARRTGRTRILVDAALLRRN
jgi:6-phosphogluconolactonase